MTITQADRVRIQTRLRRMLRSPGITLEPPATRSGSAQVRVGEGGAWHGRLGERGGERS